MKSLIVYDSKTGNTEMLAKAAAETLCSEELLACVPVAQVEGEMLSRADRVNAGFWANRGSCSKEMAGFLEQLEHKEVFLFGTAGFGSSLVYFDGLVAAVKQFLPPSARVVGSFLCQGRMLQSVRERYVKGLDDPERAERMRMLIDNFDKAIDHPNVQDIKHFQTALAKVSVN